jgi:hypothetical protein
MIRWAGHVASMGQKRNTYRILVGKLERKRTLQTARHIWKTQSETDLKARLVSPHSEQEQVAGSF